MCSFTDLNATDAIDATEATLDTDHFEAVSRGKNADEAEMAADGTVFNDREVAVALAVVREARRVRDRALDRELLRVSRADQFRDLSG